MLPAPGTVRLALPQHTLRAARVTPTACLTRSLCSSAKAQGDDSRPYQQRNRTVSRDDSAQPQQRKHTVSHGTVYQWNPRDKVHRKTYDWNSSERRPEPLDNDKAVPSGVIPRALGKMPVRAGTLPNPVHVLTLADLSAGQIDNCLRLALKQKIIRKTVWWEGTQGKGSWHLSRLVPVLETRTIALMFSKRSTRTRVASETAVAALGGTPMFLGPQDIQLGVNETLYDTAKVVSSMVDGIMARVGGHDEIETLAKNSTVPVINALSSKYHPTQILADLMTLIENDFDSKGEKLTMHSLKDDSLLQRLAGLKVAWVGDSNNILNEMLVTFPRLGIDLSVATPKGYERDEEVWTTMQNGIESHRASETGAGKEAVIGQVTWSNDPLEAVKDADVIVTDTWISMGDEASKEQRLRDFAGFQVTEEMATKGGAKPNWKFMHCLPRKPEEVDDQVFYSDRSLVFPEAENRKWTIMALFQRVFGNWNISHLRRKQTPDSSVEEAESQAEEVGDHQTQTVGS